MSYGLRGCDGRVHGLGIVGPRGLGFDKYDLLAQAGIEQCSTWDSACVARNEQRSDAVNALWETQYMTHPEVADMAAPQISLNLDTSARALQQFMQNVPVTSEQISVDSGPAYSAAQLRAPAPPVIAPAVKTAAAVPAGSPAAVQGSPAFSPAATLPTGGGFDLSSIPWYAWLGVGAVALFAFGGGRGR